MRWIVTTLLVLTLLLTGTTIWPKDRASPELFGHTITCAQAMDAFGFAYEMAQRSDKSADMFEEDHPIRGIQSGIASTYWAIARHLNKELSDYCDSES